MRFLRWGPAAAVRRRSAGSLLRSRISWLWFGSVRCPWGPGRRQNPAADKDPSLPSLYIELGVQKGTKEVAQPFPALLSLPAPCFLLDVDYLLHYLLNSHRYFNFYYLLDNPLNYFILDCLRIFLGFLDTLTRECKKLQFFSLEFVLLSIFQLKMTIYYARFEAQIHSLYDTLRIAFIQLRTRKTLSRDSWLPKRIRHPQTLPHQILRVQHRRIFDNLSHLFNRSHPSPFLLMGTGTQVEKSIIRFDAKHLRPFILVLIERLDSWYLSEWYLLSGSPIDTLILKAIKVRLGQHHPPLLPLLQNPRPLYKKAFLDLVGSNVLLGRVFFKHYL